MDKITQKILKYCIVSFGIISVLAITIPLALYLSQFDGFTFVDSRSDWGTFGDYVGGVIGTIFSFVAAVFGLISIIITARIASNIHSAEMQHNKENAAREVARFEQETELLKKQNKPYLIFERYKNEERTQFSIKNHGLGPLIVVYWSIMKNRLDAESREDYSIEEVFQVIGKGDPHHIEIAWGAPRLIVPVGGSTGLFTVYAKNGLSPEVVKYQQRLRTFLADKEIVFSYEDIFGNKWVDKYDLSFLLNNENYR